jgi:dynactin complex subunit
MLLTLPAALPHVCRYLGPVHWDTSGQDYVGVELDEPKSNKGGTVDGVFYFDAPPRSAMFEVASRLVRDT